MTERIEAQMERFAPSFCASRALRGASRRARAAQCQPVGGDINGGAPNLAQLFFRPTLRLYSTSKRGLYLCSSSTPPGGGVHGMCGYFAAQRALRERF